MRLGLQPEETAEVFALLTCGGNFEKGKKNEKYKVTEKKNTQRKDKSTLLSQPFSFAGGS